MESPKIPGVEESWGTPHRNPDEELVPRGINSLLGGLDATCG